MSDGAEKTFQFSRAFHGWWWLLGRDFGRWVPVALGWAVLIFILHQADHTLGLVSAMSWLSTAMIIEPLFAGTLYVMALNDDVVAPGEALGAALNRFVPLLVLHVLTSLGIATGLILLVLPGIALAVLWSVAFPILIAERARPIDAMRTSFSTVRSKFWPVLGLLAIHTAALIVVGAVLSAMGTTDGLDQSLFWMILDSATSVILSVTSIYLSTAIYRELGFSGAHDVSVFD